MTRSILMMKLLTSVEHRNDFLYSIAPAPHLSSDDRDRLIAAAEAFMDDIDAAIWDAWMGGLFWIDLDDDGNLAIGSRAHSQGRLFPADGAWEQTIQTRGGPRTVHLRHLYEAMSLDWTKVRNSKRDVYDGHLLVIAHPTGIPTLEPVPAEYLPLIDTRIPEGA